MALGAEQLAVVGERGRGRLRRVPAPVVPSEDALEQVLLQLIAAFRQLIRGQLFPRLPELLGRQDGARLDDTEAQRFVRSILVQFGSVVDSEDVRRKFSRVGRVIERKAAGSVRRQFEYVLGITPPEDEGTTARLVEAFARRNAALIKSVAEDETRKIQQLVTEGQRAGRNVRELAREIEERFGVSRSRARLIARDQTAKLNSQVTAQRQRDNGVKQYVWRTSDDERVRPGHQVLDDRTFSWDSPPVVDPRSGRRAHPGEDYQCRCTPEPVFDDVVEAARRAPEPPEPAPPQPQPAPRPRRQRKPSAAQRRQEERARYEVDGEVVTSAPLRAELDAAAEPIPAAEQPAAAGRLAALLTDGLDGRGQPATRFRREAREFTRRMLQTVNPTMRSRDVGRGIFGRGQVTAGRSNGTSYHHWNGKVEVSRSTRAALKRGVAAQVDPRSTGALQVEDERLGAIKTLVHEEAHAYSPIRSVAYRKGEVGRGVEEALTEMIARRTMRQFEGQALGGRISFMRNVGNAEVTGLRVPARLIRPAFRGDSPHLTATAIINRGGYAHSLSRDLRGRWIGRETHSYDYFIESIFQAASKASGREVNDVLIDICERAAVATREGSVATVYTGNDHVALLADKVTEIMGLTKQQREVFVSTLEDFTKAGLDKLRAYGF